MIKTLENMKKIIELAEKVCEVFDHPFDEYLEAVNALKTALAERKALEQTPITEDWLKDPVTTTDRSQLYDQIKADAVKCGETFSRSYPFLGMARRCVELAYDSGARKYYEKAEYDAASRLVDERMGSRKVMDFPQIYAAIKASANIEDAIKAVAELCREKEEKI